MEKNETENETKTKSGGLACHCMCWRKRFERITCVQWGAQQLPQPVSHLNYAILNILISETAYLLTARFQFQVQRFFPSNGYCTHTHEPNGLRSSGHRRMNRKWINLNNNDDDDSNEKSKNVSTSAIWSEPMKSWFNFHGAQLFCLLPAVGPPLGGIPTFT